jgi:hypothetical protein
MICQSCLKKVTAEARTAQSILNTMLHTGQKKKVCFLKDALDFSLLQDIHPGYGVHQATSSMGTRGSLLRGTGATAWRWSLISIWCAGKAYSYTYTTLVCFQDVHRKSFAFVNITTQTDSKYSDQGEWDGWVPHVRDVKYTGVFAHTPEGRNTT